jgi:hypothetical protein
MELSNEGERASASRATRERGQEVGAIFHSNVVNMLMCSSQQHSQEASHRQMESAHARTCPSIEEQGDEQGLECSCSVKKHMPRSALRTEAHMDSAWKEYNVGLQLTDNSGTVMQTFVHPKSSIFW